MITLTVLSDVTREVDAELDGDAITVAESDLSAALGWELKPEGLCQEDVCVPVRDRASIGPEGRLDLVAVAEALDRPIAVDPTTMVACVGQARQTRRLMLGGQAAPFTLPGLDGELYALAEWRGAKKLLVVFASW